MSKKLTMVISAAPAISREAVTTCKTVTVGAGKMLLAINPNP